MDIWVASLVIMNKATTNICLQGFVWIYIFIFLDAPRSAIAGSYAKYMVNFLRGCPSILQSGSITLRSHKWCCSNHTDIISF